MLTSAIDSFQGCISRNDEDIRIYFRRQTHRDRSSMHCFSDACIVEETIRIEFRTMV
jgi:hypothetical protein